MSLAQKDSEKSLEQAQQTVRVMYVHGTFAQSINTSQLHAKLAARLRDANLELRDPEYVRWPQTGWFRFFNNTHKRRMCGARNLRAALDAGRRAGPSGDCEPTFIVAHSHGSTVSLGCMNDYGQGCPLTGVACVSSPFITVSPLQRSIWSRFLFVLVVGLAAIIAAVVFGASATWSGDDWLPLVAAGIGLVGFIALFPLCSRFAKKHDPELRWGALDRERVLLLGSAFDEAALYTSFWMLMLNFLNWSVTVAGLMWIGLPLAMTTLWAVSTTSSQSTAATYFFVIVGVLAARWLVNFGLSIVAPGAPEKKIERVELVVALAAAVVTLRLFPSIFGNLLNSGSVVQDMLVTILVVGVLALFGLALMLFFSVLIALAATMQSGVGVPFSTLLLRNVVIDKTVPDIVDRYVGFSPRNNVPIRHSRLLGWGPCQDEIVEFIYQRLVAEGFVAQKAK